jgi:hypothetical protein
LVLDIITVGYTFDFGSSYGVFIPFNFVKKMIDLFPLDNPESNGNTCNTCENRQRWQCGGRVIQYCGVRKSNRTDNGLLKIKCKDQACPLYKEEKVEE